MGLLINAPEDFKCNTEEFLRAVIELSSFGYQQHKALPEEGDKFMSADCSFPALRDQIAVNWGVIANVRWQSTTYAPNQQYHPFPQFRISTFEQQAP